MKLTIKESLGDNTLRGNEFARHNPWYATDDRININAIVGRPYKNVLAVISLTEEDLLNMLVDLRNMRRAEQEAIAS